MYCISFCCIASRFILHIIALHCIALNSISFLYFAFYCIALPEIVYYCVALLERGRFNNPITPKNLRICTRCQLNEIDDEIHLLLHCCAMKNEREILYDSVAAIINIQPTNEMFLGIMTSRDITVVKSLAQFIYGCFKQIKG